MKFTCLCARGAARDNSEVVKGGFPLEDQEYGHPSHGVYPPPYSPPPYPYPYPYPYPSAPQPAFQPAFQATQPQAVPQAVPAAETATAASANENGDSGDDGTETKTDDATITVERFIEIIRESLDEHQLRRGFIQKVYAILMCQLLVTLGIVAIFYYHKPTKKWVMDNFRTLMITGHVLMLVCVVVILVSSSARRKWPMNFVYLGVFTISFSSILGTYTSILEVMTILVAVGLTEITCFGLILFAVQTKWTFNIGGAVLVNAFTLGVTYGISYLFIPTSYQEHLGYICLGVFLFSLYLVADTLLMINGEHTYTISYEEYVFAALNLYIDFLNFIMYVFYKSICCC